MAPRAIGAIAFLLSSFAPALAQGPMTPMTLPTKAPTEDIAAAVPQVPPPPIPPAPIISDPKAAPAPKIAKSRPAKDIELFKDEAAAPDDGSAEKLVGDAADTVKSSKKTRRSGADAWSPPRVDPDHMASMLNRLQLDGGYGSGKPDSVRCRLSPANSRATFVQRQRTRLEK